eukprot:GILI01037206.1.p1 GENE.GILI01037206.1~~GILI01037206.1.p1  ORF type:complete len:108 (-),score=9.80 GILI01037206.1:40-363(-)
MTEVKDEWNARYAGKIPHTTAYYVKCFVGGILACGATHASVCPFDVVKCNMQVNPEKYPGLLPGFKVLIREEGISAAGCYKGWLPTFIGYSAQGAFKYGLYEVLKDF